MVTRSTDPTQPGPSSSSPYSQSSPNSSARRTSSRQCSWCASLFQHGGHWVLASSMYCLLGGFQTCLSLIRSHYSGFAVGLVAMLMGCLLFFVALGAESRSTGNSLSESPSLVQYNRVESDSRSRHKAWQDTVSFFGSSATMSAARSIRWLLWLYAIFIVLLLLIRAFSPDVAFPTFPKECSVKHEENCSRVATFNPWRSRDETPLVVRTPQPALRLAAQVWISHQPYSSFVSVTSDLAHARFVSPFWGFTDDFLVQVTCNQTDGMATMEVQSQSRLGQSDFGVNVQRTTAFMRKMHANARKGIFPDKPCYSEN